MKDAEKVKSNTEYKSTKILGQLIKQTSLLNEISYKLKKLCRELNSSLRESENN